MMCVDPLVCAIDRQALSTDFGWGAASPNLRNFRQFYLTFPDREICYTMRSQLTWTHYRKDETVVRYSVLHGSEQLFASKYRLVLPTEEELAREMNRERRLLTEQTENSDSGKIKGGGV